PPPVFPRSLHLPPPRIPHPARLLQFRDAIHIALRPDAAPPAGREALRKMRCIECLSLAVDPAVAEGRADGLVVRYGGDAGGLLAYLEPDSGGRVGVV